MDEYTITELLQIAALSAIELDRVTTRKHHILNLGYMKDDSRGQYIRIIDREIDIVQSVLTKTRGNIRNGF